MNDDTISRQASFEKHGEIKSYAKDTIDRRAAIDIVQHECGEWKGLAKEIVKQFNGLPSAQPEQRWIPTSERLPKVREWVLCQCRAGIMDVLRFTEDGCWNKLYPSTRYTGSFVIAWMSLPEPYKEDDHD